jgi:disulfide bond formation protein DsbB
MCIYERVAMLAILIAGLLGMLAPRFLLVRLVAIALWIFGALKGLEIARRHTGYQLDPKPWDQCPLFPEFPPTLPLDQWFPNIFAAGGSCKDITWQMLNWTMPQWLTLAFGTFLAFGIVVLLSQFKRTGRKASLRNRNLFH